MKKIILMLCLFFVLPNIALAGLVTIEFNNGDSLSDWSADRRAPSGFEIVNNQLRMTIDGSDTVASSHDNTQGMQMNIGHSNFLSIDMLVDNSWTADQRYGGIWAIGYNDTGSTPSGWPMMEFHGSEELSVWDNSGWHYPDDALQIGEMNNFKFIATISGVEYYLNDTLVYVDSSGVVDYFGGVILNAKNVGTDYTVIYDNLTYGTVPEPASLALLGLGLAGFGFTRRKKAA